MASIFYNAVSYQSQFERAIQYYNGVGAYLTKQWPDDIAKGVNAVYGMNMITGIATMTTNLQTAAALTWLDSYAQAQLGQAGFVAQINTLISNLQAISDWLVARVPNATAGTTYTSAQLAGLTTLIETAAAAL